jgi:hypothetical protein
MSSFVGDKKKFNTPVWVKTNENPEIWRIGFLKVVVEEVFINAETGKFVTKKETLYGRNFWQALFNSRGI